MTGSAAVLGVAEPSISGEHDVARVLEPAGQFGVPAMVCANKWDTNPKMADRIERRAVGAGDVAAGRVPYDPAATGAQVNGVPVVEFSGGPVEQSVTRRFRSAGSSRTWTAP